MKSYKVSLFLFLLLAICLPAVAQVQLDIPFNFSAAGKSLPAGHYQVAQVFAMNQAAWSISNEHGSAIFLTNSVESPRSAHRSSLVFLAAGGTYTLVQFWPMENFGREVILKARVKTTILAQGGKYVEIGAE
jgi:hypothetical protein